MKTPLLSYTSITSGNDGLGDYQCVMIFSRGDAQMSYDSSLVMIGTVIYIFLQLRV